MKIYDCINFFNELDILEIRLNILYNYVDYFVIVESDKTHAGNNKPFYLEENMQRFEKFSDKIISYKVLDNPERFDNLDPNDVEDPELAKIYQYINNQTTRFNRQTQPDYGRDFFQKESIKRPLIGCNDEDIIIVSDADEIPNPLVLEKLKYLDLDSDMYSLKQNMYCYYLNMLKDPNWYGSKISKYKNIKNLSINELRGDPSLTTIIANGGWHFSFMGGEEMVKKKITSYSARDLVNDHILNSISKNIESGVDVFFRDTMTLVDIDGTYPEYIINNLKKYKWMIK
jgi:beta-1,4-mannosyl-glycoprotein beta-1,4-N-acetylglucosaminyltransferase